MNRFGFLCLGIAVAIIGVILTSNISTIDASSLKYVAISCFSYPSVKGPIITCVLLKENGQTVIIRK